MNVKLTLFTLFFGIIAASQETENYNKLASQIPILESVSITEKYKNDSIKREFTIVRYNIKGEIYGFYSGKYIEYYKNGNIKFERVNDRFGMPLSTKKYLKNGYLWNSTKTIELDSNAKNIEEFLFGKYNVSIINDYIEYNGMDYMKNPLVFKKGVMINNKKSGLWKKYKDGVVVKINRYKNRLKFQDPLRSFRKR